MIGIMGWLREYVSFVMLVMGALTVKLWYVLLIGFALIHGYTSIGGESSALGAVLLSIKGWGATTFMVALVLSLLPKDVMYLVLIDEK